MLLTAPAAAALYGGDLASMGEAHADAAAVACGAQWQLPSFLLEGEEMDYMEQQHSYDVMMEEDLQYGCRDPRLAGVGATAFQDATRAVCGGVSAGAYYPAAGLQVDEPDLSDASTALPEAGMRVPAADDVSSRSQARDSSCSPPTTRSCSDVDGGGGQFFLSSSLAPHAAWHDAAEHAVQREAVAECIADIEAADFIAVDLEFSGLFMQPERDRRPLQACFKTCLESIPNFLALQLGLCCGRQRADGVWDLRTHEFNLWPRHPGGRGIFSADLSSLLFLHRHGFDFNAFFEKRCEYERLGVGSAKQVSSSSSSVAPSSSDERDGEVSASDFEESAAASAAAQSTRPNTAPPCGHRRELAPAARVVAALRAVKVPLVFHNGLLDLLHLYDKFIGDLPGSVADFAEAWTAQFPFLFDTRQMAQEARNLLKHEGRLKLGELHRHLRGFPLPTLRLQHCGPLGVDRPRHGSAGKDAMTTAEVFLMIVDLQLPEGLASPEQFWNHNLLRRFQNCVALVNASDANCIHLGAPPSGPPQRQQPAQQHRLVTGSEEAAATLLALQGTVGTATAPQCARSLTSTSSLAAFASAPVFQPASATSQALAERGTQGSNMALAAPMTAPQPSWLPPAITGTRLATATSAPRTVSTVTKGGAGGGVLGSTPLQRPTPAAPKGPLLSPSAAKKPPPPPPTSLVAAWGKPPPPSPPAASAPPGEKCVPFPVFAELQFKL